MGNCDKLSVSKVMTSWLFDRYNAVSRVLLLVYLNSHWLGAFDSYVSIRETVLDREVLNRMIYTVGRVLRLEKPVGEDRLEMVS